jgi:tetratricopeptide (TPR) repeat protein
VAIGALQGMPGVGKSYLALRFISLHGAAFPGGTVRITFEENEGRDAGVLCRDLCDELRLPAGPGVGWERLREYLRSPRALLLVENADDEPRAGVAAELARDLPGVAIIVTGRFRGLGGAPGWTRVGVRPFDEAEALQQLREEHRPPANPEEAEAFRALVRRLGYLPLAIHVAAGYLQRPGSTAAGFLRWLEQKRLALGHPDRADFTHAEGARAVLSTTLELSLDVLRVALAADGERLLAAFCCLGHAPLSGFGRSLGAAIAGLDAADFERLAVEAIGLSLMEYEGPAEGPCERFRLHPLLAELLRTRAEAGPALARTTEWFLARLPERPPGEEAAQGRAWAEVQAETPALVEWLRAVPADDLPRVERAGSWFAIHCGPFRAWADLCERGLRSTDDPKQRSGFLWTLGNVAMRAGDLDRALAAAQEKLQTDDRRGAEREAALAVGKVADIFEARGQLDEALRTLREEVLPAFERLGDVWARAVTLGKVADILFRRGQLDEALRIYREEVLPVYERLGDQRLLLVDRANLAIYLLERGAPGDAEEARKLLRMALDAARKLRLPVETGQIEEILRAIGEMP